MNITFVKDGNAEDFFKSIARGMIAQDTGGYYYRLDTGKLVESQDLKNWSETNEFEFGTINATWKIYKVEKEAKEQKESLREHVLKLANSSVIKSFYSTGVAKRLNVPLAEVEKELNIMVQEGIIQKKFELLCSNDNCLRVLDTKSDKSEFKNEYECSFCGEEEIEADYIKETYTGINK
ncbi:hypothetical protein CVD28_03410 [Bacillus sp. M6-12]|uniref:hypothetical protein n=1 Tax=Bacillus sp. M6-12 TaxID=2054166 RepID=UPI000C795608|nr:hypothetical protein [Bacillus sp. M6-12]PLS19477.1 hypothetical protein CVD28_03410 [Bacillus sp. M6-12]